MFAENMEIHERIRELLADAVSDVFLKMQDEYNISCGDCPPDLDYDIETRTDDLAETMTTAFLFQLNQ